MMHIKGKSIQLIMLNSPIKMSAFLLNLFSEASGYKIQITLVVKIKS